MSIAVLCNEADLATGTGSSTETSLLEAAVEAGLDYRVERKRYPLRAVRRRREGEHWMATTHAAGPDAALIGMKGAPEQVLARVDRWVRGGRMKPLTEADKRQVTAANDRLAARGLRVLALAFKPSGGGEGPGYQGFVLAGLVALTDPIRQGVPEAIHACRRAGIRPVIITGDHARTAAAIYGELGRENGPARIFDASHVGELAGDEMKSLVRDVDVFARVSPRDKYRIVRALQASGEVVAMTGDGINDAAALRAADIGVAMGARGTDVARDVADVVLVGDDFDGIVAAIEQGRTIHANIGKSLRFLLATNVSEILVTLGGLALGIPRPMSAIQFLWINLLSDVAPALALAVEPAEPDTMTQPPRDPAAPMLPRAALVEIGRDAGILAATALAAHGIGVAGDHRGLLDPDHRPAAPRAHLPLSPRLDGQRTPARHGRGHDRGPDRGDDPAPAARAAGPHAARPGRLGAGPRRSHAPPAGARDRPKRVDQRSTERAKENAMTPSKGPRRARGRRTTGPARGPRAARRIDAERSGRRPRSRITSTEIVAVGVLNLVKSTIVTAVAGAQDVGAALAEAGVSAVRGAIRAAREIGADIGAVAREAIRGTVAAAGEIGGDVAAVARSAARGAVKAAGELGEDVATVARRAVEGSAAAAKDLGVDVAGLARSAAEGAIEAADRIGTAAGRAVRATLSGSVGGVRSLAGGARATRRRARAAATTAGPRRRKKTAAR
jgi:phosphoserine phosphatase